MQNDDAASEKSKTALRRKSASQGRFFVLSKEYSYKRSLRKLGRVCVNEGRHLLLYGIRMKGEPVF